MSLVGVDQDHQVVSRSRVFDGGVLAVARGLPRPLQHPVNLGEVDVAEQRRNHPTLRNAVFPAGFEHDLQQMHDVGIVHALGYFRQQPIMPDMRPRPHAARAASRASRSVGEPSWHPTRDGIHAAGAAGPPQRWANDQHRRHLNHAVPDARNAERPLASVALRYPHPQEGLGDILPRTQLLPQRFQPALKAMGVDPVRTSHAHQPPTPPHSRDNGDRLQAGRPCDRPCHKGRRSGRAGSALAFVCSEVCSFSTVSDGVRKTRIVNR